ncbi:PE-PGRS family protein [Streptomyces sp. NPDC057702]|uniref:PE-PGRS family protein n=1 Tax=unclassified Streptomyces TaxID=2593676 RepID=UPI0036937C7F
MEAGHVLRGLRAAVFAAVCVLLAAAGHAVMSATPIPAWAIGVALLGTGGAAWCAAGRERGPLLIMSLTAGAQMALHTLFSVAQTSAGAHGAGHGQHAHSGASTVEAAADALRERVAAGEAVLPPSCGLPNPLLGDAGSATGGDGGLGQRVTDLGDVVSSAHTMALHDGHGGLGMWSAHLLVALVCGVWLCGGEQAAFRVGRALAVRLFAPLYVLFGDTAPGPRPEHGRAGRAHGARRPRRLLLAHVIATRGPPAGIAVV